MIVITMQYLENYIFKIFVNDYTDNIYKEILNKYFMMLNRKINFLTMIRKYFKNNISSQKYFKAIWNHKTGQIFRVICI